MTIPEIEKRFSTRKAIVIVMLEVLYEQN